MRWICVCIIALLWSLPPLATGQVPLVLTLDIPDEDDLGFTTVEGLNPAGVIVGNSIRGTFAWHLTRQGVLTAIQCPAASGGTVVKGINQRGDVAGWCARRGKTVGYLRENTGTFRFIEFPGATLTEIVGLNNARQVVGDYRNTAGEFHGFVFADNLFLTLNAPGAVSTSPTGLNNVGQIVGAVQRSDGRFEGFVLEAGTYTPLRAPGAQATIPLEITDEGRIVGILSDEFGRARSFLRDEDGIFHRLTLPLPNIALVDVQGITQARQIVGRYLEPRPNDPVNPFFSRGFVVVFPGPDALPAVSASVAAAATAREEPGVAWHLDGCLGAVAPTGMAIPAAFIGRSRFCQ
jgi:hypothetical protein